MVDKVEWLPMEAPVNPNTEHYRIALEASMDEFIGKVGPMYLSALRQAFMAGAMFQLRYKIPPQETPA